MSIILTLFEVAGSLGLFLYGMKLLSEGLQKSAGDRMKSILKLMTGNSFMAVITGVIVTILVQSSSATTVMVVSFVNAGLMSLTQAIGVILGANIGTTVTGWIVATLGFKIDITVISLCAIAISLPFLFSKKIKLRDISDIFLGFGFLFLGLTYLQRSMPDISGNMKLLQIFENFNNPTAFNIIICVLLGTVITLIIQSSAAAMAVTLTMAYQGWIGVTVAAALILGQNIGTTITAYLASIGASTAAKRASWAHIMFNVIGTVIALIFFKPLLALINMITPGDIYSMDPVHLQDTLPTFLAMFHTAFNLFNTVLFFPFIKLYSRILEKLIPDTKDYDEGTYHFQYVGSPFIDGAEIYLLTIRDEVRKLADLACNMFKRYSSNFNNPKIDSEAEKSAMKNMEEYADQMQEQLSNFCIKVMQESQSPTNVASLNCIIRVLDELESVTDSCYNLTFLSERRAANSWTFPENVAKELKDYQNLVQDFLEYIRDHMDQPLTKSEMQRANDFEEQVNQRRTVLNTSVQNRLSEGTADVKMELLILEKVRHLEHIGDYCINIAESYHQAVKHTPMLQKRKPAAV